MLARYNWLALQVRIINCITRYLVVDGGRRFGKSFTCAPATLKRLHRRHEIMIDCLRNGTSPPWSTKKVQPWGGAGLPAKHARHIDPHVNVVVVAPMERHLTRAKNYMRQYYSGPYHRFLHPELFMADAGRQTWLYYGGVATKITFCVGKSIAGVVSDENDIIWIDEGGLLDNAVYDALLPTSWNREGEIVTSGTPATGNEHWFTRMILQGLDPSHEFYEPDVVEHDPNTTTIIASSYEAYDPNVREGARKAAKLLGEAYEKKWIKGDWRLPGVFIFDNWDASVHVVDYDPATRKLAGHEVPLPPPKLIVGVIDFAYSSTKPGAAVNYHVWYRNPLDRDDGVTSTDFERPLIIAIEDLQQAKEYSRDGWFQDLSRMRFRNGVRYWFCDPSRDELYQQCCRYKNKRPAIGLVIKAEKHDKPGRILLLKSLLEHSDTSLPAFLVSSKCTELPRQMASYKYRLDAQKNPTDVPMDHDDHAIDCSCFLMGHVMKGGVGMPNVG